MQKGRTGINPVQHQYRSYYTVELFKTEIIGTRNSLLLFSFFSHINLKYVIMFNALNYEVEEVHHDFQFTYQN